MAKATLKTRSAKQLTAPKTRVKKNYVAQWVGVRGGLKEKKFFTREGAQKEVDTRKGAGFKGAKVRVQTRQKVNVQK